MKLIKQLKLICQTFHFAYKIQQISLFRMILIRLKSHQLFNGVARTFSYTQAWASEEEAGISKFSQKSRFRSSEWQKTNFTTFIPFCKNF